MCDMTFFSVPQELFGFSTVAIFVFDLEFFSLLPRSPSLLPQSVTSNEMNECLGLAWVCIVYMYLPEKSLSSSGVSQSPYERDVTHRPLAFMLMLTGTNT